MKDVTNICILTAVFFNFIYKSSFKCILCVTVIVVLIWSVCEHLTVTSVHHSQFYHLYYHQFISLYTSCFL